MIFSLCIYMRKKKIAQQTHSNALPHDARLLHPARPTKLLHVFAEVALSALGPQARLALPAARPPPPGAGCSPTGRQLDR